MHELGIADSILDIARAEWGRNKNTRLIRVGIKLGDVAGVDPDSLSFCFDALVKDTELEPLALAIERSPHRRCCPLCAHEFPVIDYESVCPDCGEPQTVLASGDELEVLYIDVEES
jgi:hydrogenase nickel incorporation protein HypA/HybF